MTLQLHSNSTPPSTPPNTRQTFLDPFDYSPPASTKTMQLLTLDESEQEDTLLEMRHPRPYSPRSAADTLQPSLLQPSQFPKPRNKSPYSRSHLRSQSSAASLAAPPMTRAHSSPAFSSPQFSLPPAGRSSSPLRSPKRVRSPFRVSSEEYYQGSSAVSDIESIDEDHELDITPRPVAPIIIPDSSIQSLQLYHGNTFPRRRRPASPLHQVSSAGGLSSSTSASTSAAHSPLLSAHKFNEGFPGELTQNRSFSSISSMPSTPTSARSRSPSISSLETIPDTPDEEAEATEAEKVERLRRASENHGDSFRRTSLDTGRSGAGIRDKRKRWSVCGAEKRSDLNLETIWENGD
ncbi:hypothetical protein BLS_001334 [Venturia inaequalis]|uniref:Basic proline-rich protein n=1 Tax=Venturia inaequalis TaxID=5025 RepID=A0A8H3U1Y7_VENIN|nr:hypothetical protein BLS_001334 [Venturia inaequalis]KAE9974528.1 hypothetical protein EG327_008730 [Venturia inaequalis]RDI76610.1 hypothetical protein Vi05172_g13375 [Venturia inaequalis]